jgi:hypothetical protein
MYFIGHKNVQVINWPSGSGSEAASQEHGSADPNPKETFTDPQHWYNQILASQKGLNP